ncbi:Sodium/calcium exchanger protein, partial [Gigaspora rosea]
QCDRIYDHEDKCEFVKLHCQDYSSGIINYLQYYFCFPRKWSMIAFMWLLFLFGFVSVAASDFFCPNLSTIAFKLKLSESVAGVTFLAFGNGSPDLFSTFSAMTHESGPLAIGELIGAANFITSVVAGSMAVITPFYVTKAPFLRDVIFFSLAITFTLAIIGDGYIYLWESITLVLFYVTYAIVVLLGNWIVKKKKQRFELTPPMITNEDVKTPEELPRSPNSFTSTNDVIDQSKHQLSSSTSSARPMTINRRPSLLRAIEFRDAVNSLKVDVSPFHETSQIPTSSAETNQHHSPDTSMHSSPMHSPISTTLSSPLLLPLRTSSQITFWEKIQCTLFPSLTGFTEKSLVTKLIALMAFPTILVLKLTLPVVEIDDVSLQEKNDNNNNPLRNFDTPSIIITDDRDSVIVDGPGNEFLNGWNRWLTIVQFFLAPIFISMVLFSDELPFSILYAFIVGISLSIFCFFNTSDDEPPKYFSLLSFVGFGVAIVWIYLLANEVVGVLQALGLIMGLSDAILGLTIFAMGSSLGDFVANITIAKTGRPMMAMSACFGGPMLNILLGIGLSGTYITAKTGIPYKIQIEPTLIVSSISLLITLFSALIYLPLNEYRMSRAWGYYLISVYLIGMIINLTMELKFYEGWF